MDLAAADLVRRLQAIVVLVAALGLLIPCMNALGDESTPEAAQARPRQPRKKGVVLADRFGKGGRFEIAPTVALVANDPWTRGLIPEMALTWHMADANALELTFGYGVYFNKNLVNQVYRQTDHPPERIPRPRLFLTGNYAFSPVYGKLSFLGELVVHHDLFVVAGGGAALDEIEVIRSDASGVVENSFTTVVSPVVDFGVGERFFLGPRVAIRFDLRPYVFFEIIDGKVSPNADVQIALGTSFLL